MSNGVQDTESQTLPDERWQVVARQQSLADLLAFSSELIGVDLQFDPDKLTRRVQLRVARPVTALEVWDLTHRALAEDGLTTVQAPGQSFLSVVALTRARDTARIEDSKFQDAPAGFIRVLVPLQNAGSSQVQETLRLVLSKEHSQVSIAQGTNSVLIGDLRPQVEQALEVLALLDRSVNKTLIEEVPLQHASAVEVAALAERISAARKQVAPENWKGKVLANPASGSVLVVAPSSEIFSWLDLVEQFDREQPTTTVNYFPRRFGLSETATLVEDVIRAQADEELGEPWSLVKNALTGALVITTTSRLHEEVERIFEGLREVDETPRKPLRSFAIKHRSAQEILELLQGLIDAGALDNAQMSESSQPTSGGAVPVQGATAPLTPRAPSPPARLSNQEESVLSLAADPGTNRLIAMGEARALDELELLIETLDVRHSQVLIETLVVTLSDAQTMDLGVELQKIYSEGNSLSRIGSLFGLGIPSATTTQLPAPGGTGFSGVVLDPGDFSALLSALETINHGRTLTVPKVLVNNNQQASLDSVLQTPFAATNASTTVATTSFGGTQDAGTTIQVRPQIAEGEQIVVEYTVSLSAFIGEAVSPSLPPPRQQNQLTSVATIPDGHVVVIGGLDVEQETEATSQIPVLGSIPGIGRLFQSTSKTRSSSRFFVFLRCNILGGQSFESLRYASEADLGAAGIDDGWPALEPVLIR